MGKGRAPCCDKSQVKRGPWSPAEDLRLITFIQKHGHDNWRALPKQAGESHNHFHLFFCISSHLGSIFHGGLIGSFVRTVSLSVYSMQKAHQTPPTGTQKV